MIKEHEDIILDINLMLSNILIQYTTDVKYTVKYLDHELNHHVLEVFILGGELENKDHIKFIKKIKKSEFISSIYTLETNKLYTILLKPLEEIRNKKISKLQCKIGYGI